MEEPPQKKSRNADPAEFEKTTTKKCETPQNSIPYLNYDILRIIFQYLKAKDLKNAAKVCRTWSEAACKENRTRGPEYTIRSFTRGLIEEYLEPTWIEPSVGFYFMTGVFDNEFVQNIKERTVRLPRNYDSIILRISGIIIDDIEMESCSYSQILSAYLPQIPNVQVSTFIMPYRTLRSHKATSIREALGNCIDNFMTDKTSKQDHTSSSCLMLFCDLKSREDAFDVISVLTERCKNKRVSVWGGVVDRIHGKQASSSLCMNRQVAVVAISGFMRSWSVVIDIKCKTKQQVEKRLTVFRDQVQLKKHSMGFMFACRARGQNLYNGEKHVESTIFKKLFPKVPLVGCFGDGEFGTDTILADRVDEQKKSKKNSTHANCPSFKPWYNEFSTVFMILTYD